MHLKAFFSLPAEFEDTKGVIRIRKSKDRQQKKMDKHRSTKHPHKTKDRVTRTPLKTGMCASSGAGTGYSSRAPEFTPHPGF
jgi:hypothetical protein